MLKPIEKQQSDQGSRVNVKFRKWQSTVKGYPRENFLRLAHFGERTDKT
jgi:hypothetical protein